MHIEEKVRTLEKKKTPIVLATDKRMRDVYRTTSPEGRIICRWFGRSCIDGDCRTCTLALGVNLEIVMRRLGNGDQSKKQGGQAVQRKAPQ